MEVVVWEAIEYEAQDEEDDTSFEDVPEKLFACFASAKMRGKGKRYCHADDHEE